MKHKAKQPEMDWDKPEPFALVQETAIDFTKVLERENQAAKDREESKSKNLQFFSK